MSITVNCSCGKQFHVKDEHAGKRTTCPVCKQPLSVPGKSIAQSQPAQEPPPDGVGGKSVPVVPRSKRFSPKVALTIAGVGVLLVAVLIVVVVLSGSRSPSDAVKATFLYANEGKYSDANKGLSSALRATQDKMGMAKQLWDDVTRKGTITKIEILKEEVRGEGATVRFKIHYKEGKPLESEEDLVREDGSWKIASDHYLLASIKQVSLRELGRHIDETREWPEDDLAPNPKKERVPTPELTKPPAPKPSGDGRIDAFLGISPDFKVYAVSDGGGVKVVDLETGQQVTSPTWDRDWGHPRSVVFGKDMIAVVAGGDVKGQAVKLFSRKTGELEQNVRAQVDGAALTADGRFLAITEFRSGNGYHLILRDLQGKKTVVELRLGSNGYCSLAVVGKHVAAYEARDDQITVVEAETGKLVTKFKSGTFRKSKEFGGGRFPLAISPAGDLVACEAEDAVVLYDIDAGKVVHKLEGHLDIVGAVAFSPNGEIVASSAKDKTLRFWNVKEGKEVHVIKNLPAGASELIFSPDGKRIAVVYRNDEFRSSRKAEIRNVELK